jgi:hypothetical protein
MIKRVLEKLGAAEGLWLMAMSALATLASLLVGGKLNGVEFVSAFGTWVATVFGSAAIAGFRDWRKNGNGGGTP